MDREIQKLTYTQCEQRLRAVESRMVGLASKHRLSRSDEDEHNRLGDEALQINEHRLSLEHAGAMASGAASGRYQLEGEGDGVQPYQDDERGGPQRGKRRDGALRMLDGLVSANRLPARSAETVEQLTRTGSGQEQSWASRMAEALGSELYLSAWSRLVSDPARGHLMWSGPEQDAFRRVQQLRSETRAMSTTDTAGGFEIPLTLDPSILLSSSGSQNPLRKISRTVQIVTDAWHGVSSAGVTAQWLTEGTESSDASPTLAQPVIPVYKASAFVPFSYEIAQDAVNFPEELGKVLSDGYDQLSATAFTTGSGTGQPTGLITALAGGASEVDSIGSDVLASTDVYALQAATAPRFQPNSQWLASLPVWNILRQFETTNGALKFPSLQNDPPTLLGGPANVCSNMDNSITGAAENYVVVVGDFEQFCIVDRWPSQLELIPNLFGANQRPTGQRGAFLFARVGSNVLVPNAFRVLNVT
jgi:HK97 family phage major capsid protein